MSIFSKPYKVQIPEYHPVAVSRGVSLDVLTEEEFLRSLHEESEEERWNREDYEREVKRLRELEQKQHIFRMDRRVCTWCGEPAYEIHARATVEICPKWDEFNLTPSPPQQAGE